MKKHGNPIFNINEELILQRAIIHYGTAGPSEEETKHVLDWASDTAMRTVILESVLRGELVIRIREDGNLVFRSTPRGKTN